MINRHFWNFQAHQSHPKVAQQNIDELTRLASGLLAFEREYLITHGEKTPVFRLLSMVNSCIAEEIQCIERHLVEHPYEAALEERDKHRKSEIPF